MDRNEIIAKVENIKEELEGIESSEAFNEWRKGVVAELDKIYMVDI